MTDTNENDLLDLFDENQEAEDSMQNQGQPETPDEKGVESEKKGDEESATPAPEEVDTEESKEAPKDPEKESEEGKGEDDQSWTKTMALNERKKRQELERELEEYKSKSSQKTQEEQRAPQEERPDASDDPEAALNFTEKKFEQRLFDERVLLTQELMRGVHEDYDAMEEKFVNMTKDNPALAAQLRQAPNPAKFAYETAKKYVDFENFSDPDFLKKKEQEIEQRILAKLQKENTPVAKNSLPPTLTGKSSSASGVDPVEKPFDSLDEMFADTNNF